MAAKDDLQKAQDALNDPKFKGPYKFEGKNYSRTELRDVLIPELQGRANREAKRTEETVSGFANLQAAIRDAEKRVVDIQASLTRDRNAFSKGRLSEAELAKTEARLEDAIRARDQLTTRPGFPTPTAPATTPTTATVTPTVTPTATPTTSPTVTPTVTPTATTGGTGTATPTATGGKGKGKGKKAAAATGWEDEFKRKFPQYTYLLDVQVFGQDMSDLLRRAVQEKWYDSDQLETLMSQGLTGTNYYRTTTTNQQAFDKLTPANKQQFIDQQLIGLKDTFGNLQFTEQQLNEIATKAARDGKQGKALELFVYQQALATVPGATGFVAPTPASRVLTSSAADRVRNIGREYGVLPSDQEVQDVLTGVRSEDDLRQSYKLVARRWYKGVEEDLDSGLTIQQIFQPYRQYAAAVLEKSPNDIDFIDENGVPTMYAEALQGPEGPLSLSDWMRKLRTEDKYGWQFTQQAKDQATNLVMDMEKAFGFRA